MQGYIYRLNFMRVGLLVTLGLTLSLIGANTAWAGKSHGHAYGLKWSATWAVANKVQFPGFDDARPAPVTGDTTLRQIVRISKGGGKFRVWLSNELGTEPLLVKAANLARRTEGSGIRRGGKTLRFDGSPEITILPGERVVSDPVRMWAPNHSDLAISLYLPNDNSGSPVTYHPRALQTNYEIHGAGDQSGAKILEGSNENFVYAYLAAVDVLTGNKVPVVAAYGDSLTDGDQLAADEPIDLNQRYPNFLAKRLDARRWSNPLRGAAVANLGISGNQVLSPLIGDAGTSRFARDVGMLSGVTHVVIWEGINDIGLPGLFGAPYVTPEALQAGIADIAAQAKAAGLKVIVATLTPAGGFELATYSAPEADAIRSAVNHWIRNNPDFDAVVDLDRLVRDEVSPNLIRAELTVDGLHFNARGYKLVANAVARALKRCEVKKRRDKRRH